MIHHPHLILHLALKITFRWPLVQQALSNPGILQSTDLIEAILSYNRSDRWNFDGLKCFLDECIEDEEKSVFYAQILPKVIRNCYFGNYSSISRKKCHEISLCDKN